MVLAPNQSLSCFVVMQGSLRVLVKHEQNDSQGNGQFLEVATLGIGNTFGGARLAQGCTKGNNCLFHAILINDAFFF